MKRLHFLLAAFLLLTSSAIAVAQDISEIQPSITDTEFIISLSERTLAVSFQYSGVAGSVEDANIMLLISTSRLTSGKIRYLFAADAPETRIGEKIPRDTITQGKTRFLTKLPENVDIEELHEITGIGIALVDSLGRKSPPILLNVAIPKTMGI